MLDVLIERGGAAPGSVPPIPGTPAKPPVYPPLGPPAAPLGRQRRLKSEAEESSEDICRVFFFFFVWVF